MRFAQVLFSAAVLLIGVVPVRACYDPTDLIRIAREAVADTANGRPLRLDAALPVAPLPVFVTIEVGTQVVGCRGSLVVRSRSLQEEVRLAARAAAAHDPRYPPLQAGKPFKVTVTVIERLEPLQSVAGLGPEHGLVLRSGNRTGIVLPWEGKDPTVRLDWAHRKAGVPPGSPIRLERMIAARYRG